MARTTCPKTNANALQDNNIPWRGLHVVAHNVAQLVRGTTVTKNPMHQLYAQVMDVGDMVHSVYLYCFTNIILTFWRPPDRHYVTKNCVIVQRHNQTRLKKVIAFLVLYFVKWYFGVQFQDKWDSSNNETLMNELKTKMMSLMAKDTLKKPQTLEDGVQILFQLSSTWQQQEQ